MRRYWTQGVLAVFIFLGVLSLLSAILTSFGGLLWHIGAWCISFVVALLVAKICYELLCNSEDQKWSERLAQQQAPTPANTPAPAFRGLVFDNSSGNNLYWYQGLTTWMPIVPDTNLSVIVKKVCDGNIAFTQDATGNLLYYTLSQPSGTPVVFR